MYQLPLSGCESVDVVTELSAAYNLVFLFFLTSIRMMVFALVEASSGYELLGVYFGVVIVNCASVGNDCQSGFSSRLLKPSNEWFLHKLPSMQNALQSVLDFIP